MATTKVRRRVATDDEVAAFGRRLKSIREARGYTQRSLATDAGLSYASIAWFEKGMSQPSSGSLAALADVLGFTMDELWRGVGRLEGM